MIHPSDHSIKSDLVGEGSSVLLLILVNDVVCWRLCRALWVRVRAIRHDILETN